MCVLWLLATLTVALDGVSTSRAQTGFPVLVGAGDIASCTLDGDEATAKLLDQIEGTVFTLGDNVYPKGSAEEFERCYGPTWGRHRRRTRPAVGNHDYATDRGIPYFDYFGRLAGPYRQGFYSYRLGEWLIIALDSNVDARVVSVQGQWLHKQLEANPTRCVLAYWHHPVFSSMTTTDTNQYVPQLWQVLYEFGVDVIVNGHIHYYERFAPMNPAGELDPVRGIRQFTVGTGGATLHGNTGTRPHPHSEVRDNSTWGVIKFTLRPASYTWEFIPVEGGTFRDSGSAVCSAATDDYHF